MSVEFISHLFYIHTHTCSFKAEAVGPRLVFSMDVPSQMRFLSLQGLAVICPLEVSDRLEAGVFPVVLLKTASCVKTELAVFHIVPVDVSETS